MSEMCHSLFWADDGLFEVLNEASNASWKLLEVATTVSDWCFICPIFLAQMNTSSERERERERDHQMKHYFGSLIVV